MNRNVHDKALNTCVTACHTVTVTQRCFALLLPLNLALSRKRQYVRVIVVFTLLLAFNCSISAAQINELSLIQLIASPEKYNGKKVRVSDFLHVKFEDSVL